MKFFAAFMLAAVLIPGVCGADSYGELAAWSGELKIVDCTRNGDLPNRILTLALAKKNPRLRITVERGRRPVGEYLAESNADIVLTECPPETPPGNATIYAFEPLMVIVNMNNPLSDLSLDDWRGIYAGRIETWEKFGQGDYSIHRYAPIAGSAGGAAFAVFSGSADGSGIFFNPNGSLPALVRDFRYSVAALGPVGEERLDGVKVLTVSGVAPTPENIRSGRYPLVLRRVAVPVGADNPAVRKYLEVLRSEDFGAIVETDSLIKAYPGEKRGK